MMTRRIIPLLLLLLSLPAHAGDAFLQDLLARIDYLQVQDSHRTSYVWSGRFNAMNGDAHDMAHFYRAKRQQFNVQAAIRLHEGPRLRIALPVQMDNGYRADLYQAEPYLGGGLIVQWAATEQLSVSFHLYDALQIGGDVRESPCHDGFRRQFHCGTGLPWSDAGPHLRQSNVVPFGALRLNWRF